MTEQTEVLNQFLNNDNAAVNISHHARDLPQDASQPLQTLEQPTTPETVQDLPTGQETAVEQPPEQFVLPPEIAAKYSDLDVYLQAKFGAGIEEIARTFQDLGTFRQETTIQQEARQLQESWGIDGTEYARRMELIGEEYKLLPPEMQQSLDNAKGAQLLWAQVENKLGRQSTPQTNVVPHIATTQRRGTQQYDFRHSEILAMTPKQYQDNVRAITQAWSRGRVLKDVN